MLKLLSELAPGDITLRPESPGDSTFLKALFISVRWAGFDQVGWPDDVRHGFLSGQFALQSRQYAVHYAGAEFAIIERACRPVGRIYLFENPADIRIVDISLVREARGSGIGTALLKGVLAGAAADRKTVSLHVDRENPARRLYRRLGFSDVQEEGPYLLMEWRCSLV